MREPIFQPHAALKLLILALLIAFVSTSWHYIMTWFVPDVLGIHAPGLTE